MNPIEPTLNLESINASQMESVSETPDPKTLGEEHAIARDQKRAEVESYRQDTRERKKYARNIFILTCLWVLGVYVLLLLQGFQYRGFRLSDSIVLAAIGSTTANIVGVFLIVTRYFFPRKIKIIQH
jgi:hypothetical protein